MKGMKAILCVILCLVVAQGVTVEQWDYFELSLSGPEETSSFNPYVSVQFEVLFTHEQLGLSFKIPGFFDGDSTYKARFSPNHQGVWMYESVSAYKDLDGHTGQFNCTAPSKGNKGAVNAYNVHFFKYQDGTDHFSVGTTCYAWIHQTEDLINNTLKTLSTAPFNKLRMTVFPKWFRYNRVEPLYYPYQGKPLTDWDFTRFNPPFWHNLEKRILQLRDLGIIADVILFHPYDYGHWGFDRMGAHNDDFYLSYVIARIAAFRNVWWSAANEWDLIPDKTIEDWNRLLFRIQSSDPYGREISIHQSRKFYNQSEPWITHMSIQGHDVSQLDYLKKTYLPKPMIWDEVEYEGDVPYGWGDLTPEVMSQRFWTGITNGVYVGHGETYLHNTSAGEILWWSKGNVLRGFSPPRIDFFKKFMTSLKLSFDRLVPSKLNSDTFMLSNDGLFYLIYWHNSTSSINLDLPNTMTSSFMVKSVDYWNMKVTDEGKTNPGKFSFSPSDPHAILLLEAVLSQ